MPHVKFDGQFFHDGGFMLTPHPTIFRWQRLGALGFTLFAFFMAAFVSRTIFERLPHLEDEVAYLYQARIFAGGNITIDTPQPRQAFWQPFIIDDTQTGQRFGKYTIGYPIVLAIGEVMGQSWLINALFAMLSVALVYRLGETLFNADVGLVGAGLLSFSPMALLLNSTLMGHTVALAYTMAFIWAYWHIEQGKPRIFRWASVAGITLGLLLITRPATTIAIALPFVVWAILRLARTLLSGGIAPVLREVRPYLLLSVLTLSIGALTPLFNTIATGNPRENLYTRIWSYDTLGFGECCGRNIHTLEKGFRHARFDISLTASDLFGWEVGEITQAHLVHLQTRANYWLNTGLSFIPLLIGVVTALLWGAHSYKQGAARMIALASWVVGAVAWCIVPVVYLPASQIQDPTFSWLWIVLGLLWSLFPLFACVVFNASRSMVYTWLFIGVALCIVILQMAYWIGSQRYSTRYWYEALGAISLLSALGFVWLMRGRWLKMAVYGVFGVLLLYGFYDYSLPRINALYRFNNIGQDMLDAVKERAGDDPVLVLIRGEATGDNRIMWSAYATLTASTSPYLDGQIVAARVYGDFEERVRALFPDRRVILMEGVGVALEFVDE